MPAGKTTTRYANASSIVEALRLHHSDPQRWCFISNLRMGTGFRAWSLGTNLPNVEQSIDAWVFALWPSLKFKKIAYEVKVSRHDFFRELANPEKRQAALSVSNQFYFAVPMGLVSTGELPAEAGLVYVTAQGCQVVKLAPWRDGPPPSWSFIASVARRLQKVQEE